MNASIEAAIREANQSLPERKLAALIERTSLSADVKALLFDISRVVVKIGQRTIRIGRKILTVVFDLVTAFPAVTLGIIAALVITSLIGSVPFIGGALAAALSSLLLLLGVSAGALSDFRSENLGKRIEKFVDSLRGLAKA